MRVKPVERLAHRLRGGRVLVHAATGDVWSGRTLCGAHAGRWGYELQVVSANGGKPITCRRCLSSVHYPTSKSGRPE